VSADVLRDSFDYGLPSYFGGGRAYGPHRCGSVRRNIESRFVVVVMVGVGVFLVLVLTWYSYCNLPWRSHQCCRVHFEQ
jgi:hypothetical protein